jgi:hypothetical protein
VIVISPLYALQETPYHSCTTLWDDKWLSSSHRSKNLRGMSCKYKLICEKYGLEFQDGPEPVFSVTSGSGLLRTDKRDTVVCGLYRQYLLHSDEDVSADDLSTILDLTNLLVSGLRSKGMEDMLTNSEFTSDRVSDTYLNQEAIYVLTYLQGLTKWESTLADAISKLRDDSETHIVPACERMHLILEDLLGISLM